MEDPSTRSGLIFQFASSQNIAEPATNCWGLCIIIQINFPRVIGRQKDELQAVVDRLYDGNGSVLCGAWLFWLGDIHASTTGSGEGGDNCRRCSFTGKEIKDGQNVWQSIGGHEVGSVWGHGAYVAPDWSADFLHRELVFILDRWAQGEGKQTLPRCRLKNKPLSKNVCVFWCARTDSTLTLKHSL